MSLHNISKSLPLLAGLLGGLALLFVVNGCKPNKQEKPGEFTRAFYYWQTSLDNFDFRDSTFQTLRVPKLYVRLFDVDWDEETKRPVPVSPLEMHYPPWADTTHVVPVVFITNGTFAGLDGAGAKTLAHLVHRKVLARISRLHRADWYEDGQNQWWEQNPYRHKTKNFRRQAWKDSLHRAALERYGEIQFDCDWTASTRDRYFAFLREYKTLFPGKTLSATIRLYPYKYPGKAGVPPVDRGMLMCYNAGNIREAKTKNSLFDKKEVLSYLEGAGQYPLPLDYALPVFSWGVLFRQGAFKDILSLGELSRHAGKLSVKDRRYYLDERPGGVVTVTEDFVLGDGYGSPLLRRGDQVRIEKTPIQDVLAVAETLSERRQPGATLCLFHLNEHDLTQRTPAIRLVFDSF